MKKLLYISLLAILLSAAMSCSRSVDKRLVLADTLMWTNPDSSLAILSAINRDSLKGEENLAYHSLLLTQARFRVDYHDYPSDSLINTALDYFSDNHNREHYTRSLLYKGAYYEIHDNPVEAIKWYKQAEDNADSTDYRNLAQINMRMGMLYYNNYASNNLDLNKFKMAAHYYELLGDKKMTMVALHNCGNVLRITDINEARKCYDKALSTARELKDTSSIYSINVNYALMYIVDSLYSQAKKYILDAFRLNNRFEENSNYYMLSLIYSNQKDIDSAKYFISLPDKSQNNAYDSLLMYKALREIALCDNNISQYRKFDKQYYRISDSLEHNETKYKLLDSEQGFDTDRIAAKGKKVNSLNKTIIILAALFLVFALVTVALIIVISRKNRKDKQQMIDELKEESFGNYEELRSNLADFDNHFSKTMTEKLTSLEEIMTGAYNPNQDSKSNEVVHKISPIADDDTKFWEGLYSYINIKHNGAMDKIANDYPQLSASDLNFIKLMCCGFSDAAIAVCRNYRNVASVRGRRRKIRDKMGIEGNLTDYISSITQGLESNNSLQH
jgi:preprotein translocase subunit SecG